MVAGANRFLAEGGQDVPSLPNRVILVLSYRNHGGAAVKNRRDVMKWLSALPGTMMLAKHIDAADRKPTALLLDPIYKQHDPGPGHPEQPARY